MSPLIFRITNLGPGSMSSTGTIKNSRLSFTEMDGNLVYLESLAKSLGFTVSSGLTFSNGNLSVDFNDGVTSSTTVWSSEQIFNYVSQVFSSVEILSSGSTNGAHTWTNPETGEIVLPTLEFALYDNPNYLGSLAKYTIIGGTFSLADNDTNYIYVDWNGGNPEYVVSTADGAINDSDVARYLTVYRNGSDIHVLDYGDQGVGLSNRLNNRTIATQRFARESGLNLGLVGPTGSVLVTEGVSWNGANRIELNQIISDQDGTNNFTKIYKLSGNWTIEDGPGHVNNIYYNDGTNRISATAGKYLVNWYYRGQELYDHLFELFGDAQYNTEAEAQLANEPLKPEILLSHTFLLGRIIIEYGATSGSVESAFVQTFQATNVTSHSNLSNLQGGAPGEYYHLDFNDWNNRMTADGSQSFGQTIIWNGSNWISTSFDNSLTFSGGLLQLDPNSAGNGLTVSGGLYNIDFNDSGTSSKDVWSAEKISSWVSTNSITTLNGLTDSVQSFTSSGDGLILTNISSANQLHTFSYSLNLTNLSSNLSGNGLTSAGGQLVVLYGNGLTISNNTLQLNPNSAGNGLTYSSGVYSLLFNDSGTNSTTLWSAQQIRSWVSGNSVTSLNGLTNSSQFLTASGDGNIVLNVSSSGLTHSFSSSINFTNLAANIEGSGLTAVGGKLSVVVSNGITISNDSIQLNPNSAGNGLTYSSGVYSLAFNDSGTNSTTLWSAQQIRSWVDNNSLVRLNGLTNSSQFLTASGDGNIVLNVSSSGFTHSFSSSINFSNLTSNISGTGLTSSGGKLQIVYGNGLTVSNNILQLNPTSAGNGLTYSSGIYSLQFNDSGTGTQSLWSAQQVGSYVDFRFIGLTSTLVLNGLTTGLQVFTSSGGSYIDFNISSSGITHSFSATLKYSSLPLVSDGTYSSGVLTLTKANGATISIPVIPDWSTSTFYRTKDLVIALYENEYRIFRALSSFTASGTPFPGSQSIATSTNSYVGQWQEVSPLRGNMSEVTMTGAVSYQASLTPPTFTGGNNADVNNYNPTGLSNTNFLRISSINNNNLTGLQAPSPVKNQAIYLCNVGSLTITVKNESTSSLAGNRFLLGGDKNLQPNEGIMLIYDDISLRWRSQAIQI